MSQHPLALCDGHTAVLSVVSDCQATKIDTLVAKIEIAIERLQEYCSALIPAPGPAKLT